LCHIRLADDYRIEYHAKREKFQRYFLPAWCKTVHKIQGQTIDSPFVIHKRRKMSKSLLYTAISWSSHSNYVKFSDVELPDILGDKMLREQLKRSTSWVTGCSFEQLLNHVREQLVGDLHGYSWNDYRYDWELDHIKPRSLCLKEQMTEKATNDITNIRPLSIHRNRSRKDNFCDAILNK
ncbi:TPA_asm: hypothetical protein, partial [Powellomyces chytrid fungus MELD virus 4]